MVNIHHPGIEQVHHILPMKERICTNAVPCFTSHDNIGSLLRKICMSSLDHAEGRLQRIDHNQLTQSVPESTTYDDIPL